MYVSAVGSRCVCQTYVKSRSLETAKGLSKGQVPSSIEGGEVIPINHIQGFVTLLAKSADQLFNILDQDRSLFSKCLVGEGYSEVASALISIFCSMDWSKVIPNTG